jgi:hypothetical protein
MGLFAFLLAVFWLSIGGFFTVDALRFLPNSLSAPGRIIACQFQDEDSHGGSQACFPTIRFITKTGQRIIVAISSSGSTSYQAGDTLPVRFNRRMPG